MRRFDFLMLVAVAVPAVAQLPDFSGPTILSRGVGPALRGAGDFIRIRPYVSVSGISDNGLTPVSVKANGQIPQVNLYGVEGAAGLAGYHSWRRTILGIDYKGNYRHYSRDTYFDGSDQHLSLGVTHQASRRVSLSFREAAGSYSRDFGPLSAGGFYAPTFANVPANELFDGRTHYLSSMADMTIAKSRRLSFNLGGTGLAVRRRARGLIGVTAAVARGDVSYLVTPTSAIGVDYAFTHYSFTSAFGSSDIHTVAFNYAARLSGEWHFGIRAGAKRVETLGLRRVTLDPLVAAILGQTTGIEAFHRINYMPAGNVSLTRSFRRSTVFLGYDAGAGYGNGVYLTSRQQSVYGGVSYTARRRWNLGLSGGYDTYSSLSQDIGKYSGFRGGAGLTCQLGGGIHFVSRIDSRNIEIAGTSFSRLSYRGTVGFAFSPGEMPLSLW